MGRLRLKLLGGFEARIVSGPVLDIAARKTRALLAYLALPTGRAHSRDKLIGLLWSDRADEQARNSLRQALTELGKALGVVEPSPLVKQRDTLTLDPTTVEVDALVFEELATSKAADDLQRAVELYTGDLLDGLDARDAAFDEWLTVERQRLRALAATVLKKLLTQETGPNTIAIAQRLLALDPLQEEGHRALMRLHAEAGETSTALRQYESCREILKSELDVAPSLETTALYQSIREQSVAPAPLRPESRPASSVDDLLEVPADREVVKPSIAVLPFTNMSGDPEQDYFSDGITDDIITELSRFRSLFVIARNSSFQYKGKNLDVRQVARELGVQYIVEGSVRKLGDRLRISAQLINASTGNHLWSERYDRDIKDTFAVQDEVVHSIVAILPGRIADAGGHSARRKRTENLTAYEYFLRALAFLNSCDKTVEPRAREMLEKAIELDPQFAAAYSGLASWYMGDWWINLSAPALDHALALAKKGAALDPNDSYCCWTLGYVSVYRKEFGDARAQFERAFALNPNDSDAIVTATWLLTYTGKATEAINKIRKVLDIHPHAPPWYFISLGMALYAARQYEEAVAAFSRGFATADPFTTTYLAAAYGQLGRIAEARAQVVKFRELKPSMSMLHYAAHEPFREQADLEPLLDGIRKVGLMA